MVSGQGFEGIIFHSDIYTPTEKDISDLESKTKPYIQKYIAYCKEHKTEKGCDSLRTNQYIFVLNNLSFYKRRYTVETDPEGEKVIRVEAILVYPGDHTLDGCDWKTVEIRDGGEAVYGAVYYLTKKEIKGFCINSNG